MVGDVEQQAGVDAATMEEEPWIVGSVLEMPKEEGWQRPKKVAHEKVKFIQELRWSGEDQHRLRGGVLCEGVEEANAENAGCVDAEAIWSHGQEQV